ncbi:MAG TPA: hypothetical protein VGD60_18380 [Candidatus Acidoferrales bacterium]
MSTSNRVAIVLAVLAALIFLAIGGFYYWQHRPLPPMVSTVPGVPIAGPEPDILSELPSDAPVIAYVDVAALRKLQNSPLAAVLGLTSPGPQADRDYAAFVRDTGFDYERDLDHAGVAMWPAGLGTPSNVLGDDRVISIADGRFDQQKIKAYALRTGKVAANGAREVLEVPGNPPVALEFLSPTRIVIASGKNPTGLLAALHTDGSGTRDPALQARIERVAGAPIFGVARTSNLPSSFYANFRNAPQLDQLIRSVQALTLAGQPDGENLRVAIDAESDSMKDAMQISFLLETGRMAGSMALSSPDAKRQMSREQIAFLNSLLSDAKITHRDKLIRLNFTITRDMLATPATHSSSPTAKPSQPAHASGK